MQCIQIILIGKRRKKNPFQQYILDNLNVIQNFMKYNKYVIERVVIFCFKPLEIQTHYFQNRWDASTYAWLPTISIYLSKSHSRLSNLQLTSCRNVFN